MNYTSDFQVNQHREWSSVNGEESVMHESHVLEMALHITDSEVIEVFDALPEGRNRHDFAMTCLKIGVLALKQAEGQIDVNVVRNEGEKLLSEMKAKFDAHQNEVSTKVSSTLREYFDPNSGRFNERVDRLLEDGGDLDRVMREQIGSKDSVIAQTLSSFLGESSPILKMLSPSEAEGVIQSLNRHMTEVLEQSQTKILQQFTLDDESSALAKLVSQLKESNQTNQDGLVNTMNTAMSELSLDKKDSALSRLVKQVQATQKAISSEFTLDSDSSALARMKNEMVGLIEKQMEDSRKFQSDILEQVTSLKTRKEEAKKTTLHGNEFESDLYELINDLHKDTSDVVIESGKYQGLIRNCKKGDIVIELGPEHVAAGSKIVIEAKGNKSYTLKMALMELDEARKNRGADVGVFVFSKGLMPDGINGIKRFGSDVICEWDAADPATDLVPRIAVSLASALLVKSKKENDSVDINLKQFEMAVRRIEQNASGLLDVKKLAETIKNNGQKIIKSSESISASLLEDVEYLDDVLSSLTSVKA